ncbi:S-adenosylmethionine:tRNA ribosyltransferase-isomerase [Jatrophihabitans endophyticus]|uniref:S-adenosylmethionine:tRNA ribosyltransferase-isomerase n=1 Tax=Jatrophihabitans endophyticus TaxID=1206085 RepID=A0A1M5EBQ1_9ACTN|nr:S-adenosylmethionine:tRNA ribosyltransferase-isomerase [Jatrophihabitans endophyticus]SHF76669.1 S-adenosylmethionine:tRNA ribosyltransferase-isomerase [Jatrophihabitans endophyticus]
MSGPRVPSGVAGGVAATEPPSARDGVRLLVAHRGGVEHARFPALVDYLSAGDLLVVNTSRTLPAAVDGVRAYGRAVTVHFATALDDGTWVVEIRPREDAAGPVPDARAGETITLPDRVPMRLLAAHPAGQRRLWRASVAVEGGVAALLDRHGRPIRYSYVARPHPLPDYQTVFAREPGSAEMPSAGRPFTVELVTELVTRGIAVAPIVLHTGVSSQEPGEQPQPERFRVPGATARYVNTTRAAGGRVVAVGTSVTRALESATDDVGVVRERRGWTDLVLGPAREARVVSGLLTGWHESGASHLDLLRAVAGRELVERAYAAASARGYRWHEFGDSCLLLP